MGACLSGCVDSGPSQEYVTGTVLTEMGNIARIEESSGALFGNESVKIGDPTYLLEIQTPQGLYIVSVIEDYKKPLEALARAIEEGSQVRIEKRDLDNSYRFGEDKVGHLRSDEIVVVREE